MVVDPEKAWCEVDNYPQAVSWSAQTALRDAIGRIDLTDISARRAQLDYELKETLNEKELAAIFAPIKKAPVRPVWLSNDRRPDSDKPPVEIPESLKRSVGMKPEEQTR